MRPGFTVAERKQLRTKEGRIRRAEEGAARAVGHPEGWEGRPLLCCLAIHRPAVAVEEQKVCLSCGYVWSYITYSP